MAPDTQVLDAVLQPDPAEESAMAAVREQIDQALAAEGYQPCLIGPDGEHIELPASAFKALAFVVSGMAAGQTMTLVPSGRQLASQQAAVILHMSRPPLIKLLDRKVIAYERVGSHRRLRVEDVLAYRAKRAAERQTQLDELSQVSQDYEGEYR